MLKVSRLFQWWSWLKIVRENAMILFYAWRHPQTPQYLKGILTGLVIYIISPIDLLPDYLPLMGIADDAAIFTGAMLYLTNLLPASVLAESRLQSEKWQQRMPYIFFALAVAVVVWIGVVILLIRKLLQ